MLEKFLKNRQNKSDENLQEETELEIEKEIEELKTEAEKMDEDAIQKHEKHYSDEGLWKKVQKFSKKAGSTVVYVVLILYFTMQKPEVPLKVKATIAGALGYFILPIDLIPDVAAGVGFVDDFAVVTAALVQVAMYIDEDTKNKARAKLRDWFGDGIDTSEIDSKLE